MIFLKRHFMPTDRITYIILCSLHSCVICSHIAIDNHPYFSLHFTHPPTHPLTHYGMCMRENRKDVMCGCDLRTLGRSVPTQ